MKIVKSHCKVNATIMKQRKCQPQHRKKVTRFLHVFVYTLNGANINILRRKKTYNV